ncbi:hypothetical protein D3C86_889590 [compost metagenome]
MISTWLMRSNALSTRGLRTMKGSRPAIRCERSKLHATPPMKADHTNTSRGSSSAQCGVVWVTKRANTT